MPDSAVVILILVGALLTLGAGLGYFLSSRAAGQVKSWPTVNAKILSSDLVQAESVNPGNVAVPVYTYGIAISYSYTVGGQAYRGNRVKAGYTMTYNRAEAEADLARYPAGTERSIRYNPRMPGESFLEAGGASSYTKGLLAVGVGFLVLGAFLALL